MKKSYLLLYFMIFLACKSHAQNQKIYFSIGPEVSVPTFTGINSLGIGGGVSVGHFFTKKFAGVIDISFNHFKGDVIIFLKMILLRALQLCLFLQVVNIL